MKDFPFCRPFSMNDYHSYSISSAGFLTLLLTRFNRAIHEFSEGMSDIF